MTNPPQSSSGPFWLSGLILLSGIGLAVVVSQFTPADAAYPGDRLAHEPQAAPSVHHSHGGLEIPAGQPVPTVKLLVHPDRVAGWNLEVQVTHFRFAPENLNARSLPTEGHAHLYVDGKKIARLYGSWFYLEALPAGRHQVMVSLNTNGHEALTYRGQSIVATAVIDVPATR